MLYNREIEYKRENRAYNVQGGWLATLSTPPESASAALGSTAA